jgi:hypothetical protein
VFYDEQNSLDCKAELGNRTGTLYAEVRQHCVFSSNLKSVDMFFLLSPVPGNLRSEKRQHSG